MIDVLPDHWLVWVCDHGMQDNAHDAFMADQRTALKSKSVAVIIKNRQKKSGGKPPWVWPGAMEHDQKYRRRMDDRVVIQEDIQFE